MDVRSFITGMSRSGTMWLANVLDKDPSLNVYHEPIPSDAVTLDFRDEVNAKEYMERRRIKMEKMATTDWCEVNSLLRYFVPALKEEFNAPVIGLVRNGRLTVRSLVRRDRFFWKHKGLARFAVICEYWSDCYKKLAQECDRIFRLEDLNLSYVIFKDLCDIAGVHVTQEQWKESANVRRNQSMASWMPLSWTEIEQVVFDEICGDVYRGFGYL